MEKKLTHSKWFLYLTEFFAGMSVMAVELGASRLMAPYFSSSQIVWTVIIGVIMIAMAVGNIWGGRMADKSKSPDRLYGRVIIAAIWIALIPFVGRWMIAGISFLLATFITKNFLVWAAFALLLLVCAGQLYRRRRMESAGDTVAIPVLKPVLKYIVALFAGLAMPVGVYGVLLNVPAYRAQLAPFLLLTVLGAALGFVISEMAIRKSLRVPRTVWRGCAVTAAVCCLVVVGAKCDLSGYARRIPDTAQVKSVRIICNSYNSTLTEAENIQAVEDIHRAVVAEREKITDDTSITSLQLTYKLSNGKVLMREYTPPDTSTRLAQIEQVLNCDEARASRNTPELAVTLEHLTYANIGYEAESGDYLYMELTAEQALDLYENAIVPDCADGTMGRAWLTDSGTRQGTAYAVTISYQLSQYDPATGETTYADVDYTPLTDSTRTLAWLRAHGIEPLLEGDSIKYGGDADTQPAINTYETTDSSFGR